MNENFVNTNNSEVMPDVFGKFGIYPSLRFCRNHYLRFQKRHYARVAIGSKSDLRNLRLWLNASKYRFRLVPIEKSWFIVPVSSILKHNPEATHALYLSPHPDELFESAEYFVKVLRGQIDPEEVTE